YNMTAKITGAEEVKTNAGTEGTEGLKQPQPASFFRRGIDEVISTITTGIKLGCLIYVIKNTLETLRIISPMEGDFSLKMLVKQGILVVVISRCFNEVKKRTCQLGHSILGKREEYAELKNWDSASTSDRLRNRLWVVISKFEEAEQKVDMVYSRTFSIRSTKELLEAKIGVHQMYHMEI